MGIYEKGLERLLSGFVERYPTQVSETQLPPGVLSITFDELIINGTAVIIEARETDRNPNGGLYTIFERGINPNGRITSPNGTIITGVPTPYERQLLGPAIYQREEHALRAGRKAAQRLDRGSGESPTRLT